MKKFISVFLSLFLLLNTVFVATPLANTSSIAERVLLSIRPRIPDTSPYEEFDSSTHRTNDRIVFNFNWSSNKDGKYKSMYASALESGIIISYGFHQSSDSNSENQSQGFDRITKEEALSKTRELLKKLNPDIGDKLTLSPISETESFADKSFSFHVTHTENGIPVLGDEGRVTVDINAEKITSFNLSFTEALTYPSAIKIVDLATAKKAFTEEIGLDLYYKLYTDIDNKTTKVFPVYSPKNDNVYINAVTGDPETVIPFFDTTFSKNEAASDMITGGSGGSLGFTPAELKEISNLRKLLTKDEAERLLRSNKLLKIDEEYLLEECSTRKISLTEDIYGHSLVFSKSDDERQSFIYININAETGELLSFSRFADLKSDSDTETNPPTAEKASLILKELAPQKHTEYQLRAYFESADDYFVFDRYVNGVRVEGNTAAIELDKNGELISWRISYTNADFPFAVNIVPAADICQKLFDEVGYSLMYIPQKSVESLKHPDVAKLIYTLGEENLYFDVFTGKRVSYDGTEYKSSSITDAYTDISGHYAEDKINGLRRFGIGFDSTEFLPDDAIIQKDFITLINAALGGGPNTLIKATESSSVNEQYALIKAAESGSNDEQYTIAKRLGIIKDEEISPDSKVSRLKAAIFLCRAMKIEKYAQLEQLYNCPFKDVKEGKGYVTLLWGLKILNGTSSNTFSPSDNLTRAQSAILIYNLLENN